MRRAAQLKHKPQTVADYYPPRISKDRRTAQRVVQQTEHGSSSAMNVLLRLVQSKE
jgi:hypothetical protein